MQTTDDSTYLHECARLHGELTTRLSGQAQDLEAVERAVAGVQKKGELCFDDVETIVRSPHFSAGQEYWAWPSRTEFERSLSGQKLAFRHLPTNEKDLIKRLRSVFKTIDAVSVILRFVVPKYYGILSAPVEHVLGIPPAKSSLDRYINYLEDLREIRQKYRLATAAQVDQALWTLQVGVYGDRLRGTSHLKKAHEQDRFLTAIRIKNLANALFNEMPRLDLADALAARRPDLAGQLAALEFERAVRRHADAPRDRDLNEIIESAAPAHLKGSWHWCRCRRNDMVHRRDLDQREVETLIQYTREVLALPRLRH